MVRTASEVGSVTDHRRRNRGGHLVEGLHGPWGWICSHWGLSSPRDLATVCAADEARAR